jgi:CBS domain-containing protein
MDGSLKAELTAKDIMTPDPVTVGPDMTVTDAAHLMTGKHIGALPVVEKGKLVGLVTEGDLIMADVRVHFPTYLSLLGGYIFAPGAQDRYESALRKAVGATVADVMTTEPITVGPDALVTDVATLIVERDVARVPVMDGEELVGIVSKSDIVRSLVG